LASIHFADAMLGRVLDALETSPHRDNTIVVLWSDHGWHLGEKEHWQKFTGWRACARVPLMVRVPKGAAGLPEGTQAGSVCSRPVSLVDLFSTLTELCGLPAKSDIESRSFVPLLRDPAAAWPHTALTHLDDPDNYALSTERWRYLHYKDGGEELYDIQTDPHEWTNLASKPEHAEKLAEMRSLVPKQIVPVHESQPGINAFVAELEITPAAGVEAPNSKAGGKSVRVLFQNHRQTPVKLVCLDDKGVRHARGELQLASRRLVSTFSGHTWLLLDENDKLLGHVVAPEKSARIKIE
jgi:hypothetical protein